MTATIRDHGLGLMRHWSRPRASAPTLDVSASVRDALEHVLAGVPIHGRRVAVGLGSRSLPQHARFARAIVAELSARGARAVIVPAMGGHGGDEAGQRAILEDQGIVDLAPMDTSLETTLLGTTPEGVEVHWSRAALECDLTILFNRVAPHPNLSSRLQSGFTKMSVIGFGKPRGATTMHRAGVSEHLEAAGAVVRQHSNLVGGIAMLCDGEGQPSELVGLTVDELPEKELAVLERARAARFTLPFESIDVLVLDWFGKDISPTGIDRVLLGRRPTGADPVRIGAILALGLSPKSRGNMLGVGFADAVTARVLAAMDADQMAANLASSGDVEACTIPRVFENDRQALDWAVTSFGPRIARIESTAHLGQFLVSDGIILPGLTRGDVSPWSFDDAGSLDLREPWMSRRENA